MGPGSPTKCSAFGVGLLRWSSWFLSVLVGSWSLLRSSPVLVGSLVLLPSCWSSCRSPCFVGPGRGSSASCRSSLCVLGLLLRVGSGLPVGPGAQRAWLRSVSVGSCVASCRLLVAFAGVPSFRLLPWRVVGLLGVSWSWLVLLVRGFGWLRWSSFAQSKKRPCGALLFLLFLLFALPVYLPSSLSLLVFLLRSHMLRLVHFVLWLVPLR